MCPERSSISKRASAAIPFTSMNCGAVAHVDDKRRRQEYSRCAPSPSRSVNYATDRPDSARAASAARASFSVQRRLFDQLRDALDTGTSEVPGRAWTAMVSAYARRGMATPLVEGLRCSSSPHNSGRHTTPLMFCTT